MTRAKIIMPRKVLKKKGQISMEFFLIVGLCFVVLSVILVELGHDIRDANYKKEYEQLRDIGIALQKEFYIAAQVHPGYYREFRVPNSTSDGSAFDVRIEKNTLILNSSNDVHVFFMLPNVTGSIVSGQINTINTSGGNITLN